MTAIHDKITKIIEDNYDCTRGAELRNSVEVAAKIVAALPGMVLDLDFQHVNNNPPVYDAGQLSTGWYRVQYSGVDSCWLTLRGHRVIIARSDDPESAKAAANAHHRAQVLAALGLGE